MKLLVQRLRDMVSQPDRFEADDEIVPLSQLLLNSHSPVVLSALIDRSYHAVDGVVLFADTSTVSDPLAGESRRKTRLRPVRTRPQGDLFDDEGERDFVSDYEVKTVLETASAEG
ncbi:hypothetical protein P4118_05095 [Pseudomonas aeruginosa]|nr:hypothetical protein [Pseudomonas aeruginosa]